MKKIVVFYTYKSIIPLVSEMKIVLRNLLKFAMIFLSWDIFLLAVFKSNKPAVEKNVWREEILAGNALF